MPRDRFGDGDDWRRSFGPGFPSGARAMRRSVGGDPELYRYQDIISWGGGSVVGDRCRIGRSTISTGHGSYIVAHFVFRRCPRDTFGANLNTMAKKAAKKKAAAKKAAPKKKAAKKAAKKKK